MVKFVNLNGKIIPYSEVIISPDNLSFKYGDGCFETITFCNGEIILKEYHFERLFKSLEKLKLQVHTSVNSHYFEAQVKELAKANNHTAYAKVRLMIWRKKDYISKADSGFNYLIETMSLDLSASHFNKKGLTTGIYKEAQKSCDSFSFIKSNNRLPYTMARLWANENNLDDCIVCNCNERIADSTIANIFIVENGIIKTPSLDEGCISGVMRKYLLTCLRKDGYTYYEEPVTIDQLLNASEVFLTNAIRGIKWIGKIDKSEYGNDISTMLYEKYIRSLFAAQTF